MSERSPNNCLCLSSYIDHLRPVFPGFLAPHVPRREALTGNVVVCPAVACVCPCVPQLQLAVAVLADDHRRDTNPLDPRHDSHETDRIGPVTAPDVVLIGFRGQPERSPAGIASERETAPRIADVFVPKLVFHHFHERLTPDECYHALPFHALWL